MAQGISAQAGATAPRASRFARATVTSASRLAGPLFTPLLCRPAHGLLTGVTVRTVWCARTGMHNRMYALQMKDF